MNQLNEKEKQILEDHEKASEILKVLKDKEVDFMTKIDNIKQEMAKLQTEVAVVNSDILTLNEKIESTKNESSTGAKDKKISFEELKINCANIINTFIREIPPNNINKANLRFKIKYGKMNLERLIEDENIDFHRLKVETKVQFDKSENDFFFTDENGNIYLDNLNIRRALFPLESVVIENYVPIIYVIDRKTNIPDLKEHKPLQVNSNVTEDNKPDNYLILWNKAIATAFQLPTYEEFTNGYTYSTTSISVFNKFNKNFGFIRLIQTKNNPADCNEFRVNNTLCTRTKLKTKLTLGKFSWVYNNSTNSKIIRGSTNDFDDSGYYEDFNLNSHTSFYQSWTKLNQSNFIDQNTIGVITVINYYNINHDLIVTLNVLHELIEGNFRPTVSVNLFDLTPLNDVYLYFSIILSLINLFSLFTVLKKKSNDKIYTRKDQGKPALQKFKEYMETHFRQPDIFETVIVVMRFQYYGNVGQISISLSEFNDLSAYSDLYELLSNLNCAVLFVFMFNIINHVASLSDDFKIIAQALVSYIGSVSYVTFTMTILFLIASLFCGYFLFGDSSTDYYRNIGFIFVNVLSAFYRGSLDKNDFDPNSNRYASTNTGFIKLIINSETPFFSVVDKIGMGQFYVFSIVFYLFINFVIKTIHSSFFLVKYRSIQDAQKKLEEENKQESENAN